MITFGDENGRIINTDSDILKTFDEKYISFDSSSISVLKFSPNGATLVCGTSNGELWVLDSETRKCLGKEKPFRNKKLSKISHCAFYDDHIFAIAVCIYKLKWDQTRSLIWVAHMAKNYIILSGIFFRMQILQFLYFIRVLLMECGDS